MVTRPTAPKPSSAVNSAPDAEVDVAYDWQTHPSVNSPNPCPWCGTRALHEQHCKQICLACGWYQSCVD